MLSVMHKCGLWFPSRKNIWSILVPVAALFIASNKSFLLNVHADSTAPVTHAVSAAFSNGMDVMQLSLTGTVTKHAGPSSDTGSATLTASEDGSGTVSYALATSGNHIESCSASGTARSCTWAGGDGVSQDLGTSLTSAPLLWYAPNLALQAGNPDTTVIDDGVTTLGGSQLRVLEVRSISWANLSSKRKLPYYPMLLGLDPNTLLPTLLQYKLLAAPGSTGTINLEVTYSGYHSVSGIQVPSKIQRRLNGALDYELQIQSATAQ